ncbi:YtcA family lipoprotein [Microbaculum marinisediminis]|uniref:Uncharacterized protein YtcA n=1 Tax=Microbaculum marinisediminis TaxID=2931392 RepID=A0AAW5R1E8_9HYPH|nr:YtcA family lipoprotein [Microbaculum sp. A6E488]MCT8972959.1 YtcA family lipoprotein [Microbaculum sp. A6E488]
MRPAPGFSIRTMWVAPVVGGLLLAPDRAVGAAPSIPMFGSFFPAWLLCVIGGVLLTVLLRAVFVLIGLDDILKWRVPVYMTMAVGLNFVLSLVVFGR